MEIVGLSHFSFTGSDNKEVSGYKVHCTFDGNNENHIDGMGVMNFFISDAKCGSWRPALGQNIDPRYNDKGRLISVDVN